MRISNAARKLRVALFTVALAALSIGTVAPVSAQPVLQGIGVAKGCDASTPVGDPYGCAYGFTNNPGVNPSNNTITITSVVDIVFAAGGNVASGNILPSLSLVFTGTASCSAGRRWHAGQPVRRRDLVHDPPELGDPDAGALVLHGHQRRLRAAGPRARRPGLGDWQATCDVTPGCSTLPIQNQAVGQTTITPGTPQIVTSATPTIVAGQTAQDSATISGLLGNAPAGNIVFTLFGPAAAPTCTPANLVFTSGPFPVTANGTFGPATSTALAAPGNYYWIATYTDTNGSNNNVATPCGDTNETTTVQQPDANIQISPLSATNAVNTNHTLTGHVNVSNDGVTFSNAPAGTLITFTKVSGPGSFVGGNTCTTVAATGSCTVQISSAADGTTVVNAETDVTVNTVLLHRETNGTGANSADASKVWVNANIQITPANDTNPVGSNHVLTITINAINGTLDAGRTPRPRRSSRAPAASSAPTPAPTPVARRAPRCTVTITSAVPARRSSRRPPPSRSTARPSAAPPTRPSTRPPAAAATPASSGSTRNIQITPATATNPVGTNHVLTITINAINGTIDAGPHTATASIVSGPGSFVGSPSCTYTGGAASATLHRHHHLGRRRHHGRLGDLRHPGQRPDLHPHHQHGRQHGRRRQRQRREALGRNRHSGPVDRDHQGSAHPDDPVGWHGDLDDCGHQHRGRPAHQRERDRPGGTQLREDLQRHPPPWPERARLYLHPGRHHGQHDQRRDRSRDTAHRP